MNQCECRMERKTHAAIKRGGKGKKESAEGHVRIVGYWVHRLWLDVGWPRKYRVHGTDLPGSITDVYDGPFGHCRLQMYLPSPLLARVSLGVSGMYTCPTEALFTTSLCSFYAGPERAKYRDIGSGHGSSFPTVRRIPIASG